MDPSGGAGELAGLMMHDEESAEQVHDFTLQSRTSPKCSRELRDGPPGKNITEAANRQSTRRSVLWTIIVMQLFVLLSLLFRIFR